MAAPNPGPGPRRGTVLIGPRVFTVNQSAPEATPPFGFIDTPLDGTQVDGSVAIGGWALDDLGVFDVRLYRNAVAPEPPGHAILLGKAVFVENARPDIERAYPSFPHARRAGWGFMLLTNMLPQQGNGTFEISAYAVDGDLTEALLGRRTIVVNNAIATTPFGAIDTPRQGETIAGAAYVNFGWALTPQPKAIPPGWSTFLVYVDGVPLGPVNYNTFRSDIAGAVSWLRQLERSRRLSRHRHDHARRRPAHDCVDGRGQPRRGRGHRQPILQRVELGAGDGAHRSRLV